MSHSNIDGWYHQDLDQDEVVDVQLELGDDSGPKDYFHGNAPFLMETHIYLSYLSYKPFLEKNLHRYLIYKQGKSDASIDPTANLYLLVTSTQSRPDFVLFLQRIINWTNWLLALSQKISNSWRHALLIEGTLKNKKSEQSENLLDMDLKRDEEHTFLFVLFVCLLHFVCLFVSFCLLILALQGERWTRSQWWPSWRRWRTQRSWVMKKLLR